MSINEPTEAQIEAAIKAGREEYFSANASASTSLDRAIRAALLAAARLAPEPVGESIERATRIADRAAAQLDAAISAITFLAPGAVTDDGWRTMDSAPKDGTEVLLWLGAPWSRVEKARWHRPWNNWQCGALPSDPMREELSGIGSTLPTRWRPLPAPPSTQPTGERNAG